MNLEDGRRQSNVPKGTPRVPHRYPTGTPGQPRGSQRRANGSPKASEREPKRPQPPTRGPTSAPGRRSGAQGHPKGSQTESKDVPKQAHGTQRTPKGSQRGIIYLQTSDQPPQRKLCYTNICFTHIYIYVHTNISQNVHLQMELLQAFLWFCY